MRLRRKKATYIASPGDDPLRPESRVGKRLPLISTTVVRPGRRTLDKLSRHEKPIADLKGKAEEVATMVKVRDVKQTLLQDIFRPLSCPQAASSLRSVIARSRAKSSWVRPRRSARRWRSSMLD